MRNKLKDFSIYFSILLSLPLLTSCKTISKPFCDPIHQLEEYQKRYFSTDSSAETKMFFNPTSFLNSANKITAEFLADGDTSLARAEELVNYLKEKSPKSKYQDIYTYNALHNTFEFLIPSIIDLGYEKYLEGLDLASVLSNQVNAKIITSNCSNEAFIVLNKRTFDFSFLTSEIAAHYAFADSDFIEFRGQRKRLGWHVQEKNLFGREYLAGMTCFIRNQPFTTPLRLRGQPMTECLFLVFAQQMFVMAHEFAHICLNHNITREKKSLLNDKRQMCTNWLQEIEADELAFKILLNFYDQRSSIYSSNVMGVTVFAPLFYLKSLYFLENTESTIIHHTDEADTNKLRLAFNEVIKFKKSGKFDKKKIDNSITRFTHPPVLIRAELMDEMLKSSVDTLTFSKLNSQYGQIFEALEIVDSMNRKNIKEFNRVIDAIDQKKEKSTFFSDLDVHLNKAIDFERVRQYTLAITELQAADRFDFAMYKPHINFHSGIIYQNKNLHDSAIFYFKKGIEFTDDTDGQPYIFLGRSYRALGNYTEALVNFQAAFKRFDKFGCFYSKAWPFYEIGHCYAEREKWDSAYYAYQKARQVDPDNRGTADVEIMELCLLKQNFNCFRAMFSQFNPSTASDQFGLLVTFYRYIYCLLNKESPLTELEILRKMLNNGRRSLRNFDVLLTSQVFFSLPESDQKQIIQLIRMINGN